MTAFKKTYELCHVHHMQSIDLSECTYAQCVCVCVCAKAHLCGGFFTIVYVDEGFLYQ